MPEIRFILILLSIITLSNGCNRSTPNDQVSPQSAENEVENASTSKVQSAESSTTNPVISDSDFLQRYNQAVGLMGQSQYSQAFDELNELKTLVPDNVDLAVDTAIARLNMAGDGDLQIALQILKGCLLQSPKHTRANYCVGLIESYMGPPANPTPYLKVAALGAPDDPDAAYLLAKSYEQEDLPDEAKKEYLRSLELNPYYASSLLGLARIARMRGDLDESTALIEQFENMKANPNGRVFEFAYKRMGKLGEVGAIQGAGSQKELASAQLPPGDLFEAPFECDKFEMDDSESTSTLAAESTRFSLSVADINQDEKLDLVMLTEDGIVALLDIAGDREVASKEQFPWMRSTSVNAIAYGDIDHNGKLDVVLARQGDNQLWYRTADGWKLSSDEIVGGGELQSVACRLYDSDHDGDLDILFVNRETPVRMLNNNRDGTFRLLELDESFRSLGAGTDVVALGDFDNHRDTDILLINAEGAASVLWNDRLWDHRLADDLPIELKAGGIVAATCRDVNNDGALELVFRRKESIEVWKKLFDSWEKLYELALPSGNLDQFALVDLNGDGNQQILADAGDHFTVTGLDGVSQTIAKCYDGRQVVGWTVAPLIPNKGLSLIFVDSSGKLNITNPGPGRFEFAAAQFAGAENSGESMRSNFSGIGTRWKAQIGAGWSTGQVFPSISGGSQSLMPEVIGMRGVEQIDFIAIDWTDGVFQAELALRPDSVKSIKETQRQLASCPVVFAWNGEKIDFVTDVLGVGGIGFLVGPHEYADPRPWENLLLTPAQLQPCNGRLIIKLAEPMEESCYLRSAELKSIHLPEGWDFAVDERFGGSEPLPTGEIRFFRKEWSVQHASSNIDQNCTDRLLVADGSCPEIGPIDKQFIGLIENEFLLEFQFGDIPSDGADSERYGLLIDGWVEYPYSQTVFAAWQAGKAYLPPSLEVQQEDGQWESAWPNFGFPAGMPRRMLLPLPENIDPGKRMRIRSELQVYWDRIALVQLEDCPQAQVEELRLEKAELRRSGFAKRTTLGQFRPYYDYSQRTGTWDARHHPGYYTRLGDVTELLELGRDDLPLVIFGPGEELHLEFVEKNGVNKLVTAVSADVSPDATREGSAMRRLSGYILQLNGWCKDLDLYTKDGNSLGPVPGSSGVNSQMELEYNSRYESGPWYSAR